MKTYLGQVMADESFVLLRELGIKETHLRLYTHTTTTRSPCVAYGALGRHRLQVGFSLIELMIAITIGMIILLAISVLFSQVSLGFRATDDSARAMENGNFALRVLGEDLRMAGFVGMTSDMSKVRPLSAYSIGNNCDADAGWPFDMANSIQSVAPGTLSTCIAAGSFDASSPAIVVRHAEGLAIPKADLVGNNGFFIQSGMDGGWIFKGSDYAGSVFDPGLYSRVCGASLCSSAEEAPIFGYVAHVYYIRPCSRVTGGTCPDGDIGPTLVRLQIAPTATPSFVETPIAEGVERMAVVFQDEKLDVVANPVAATSARISLLVRTRMAGSYNDSSNTYTLADGSTFNCTAAGVSCNYRRFLYNDTVVLKNFDFRP